MKTCRTCGRRLPLTVEFFYPNKPMPDGFLNHCKDCVKAKQKAYNAQPDRKQRKAATSRAYYAKDPQRWIDTANRWHDANPDKVRATSRRWKAKAIASGANRAYLIVHRAIRSGLLVRPDTCEACGRMAKIEAAHEDYSRPLDVVWLCRSCHVRWDKADPKIHPPLIS